MTSAAKVVLTAADICVIIDACSKNRVKSLAYSGLNIEFDAPTPDLWRNTAAVEVDQPEGGETPSGGSYLARPLPVTAQTMQMSDEDLTLMEEMRLAQLMTDNPMAYEQEMIDAHVQPRVTNGSGEDSRRA